MASPDNEPKVDSKENSKVIDEVANKGDLTKALTEAQKAALEAAEDAEEIQQKSETLKMLGQHISIKELSTRYLNGKTKEDFEKDLKTKLEKSNISVNRVGSAGGSISIELTIRDEMKNKIGELYIHIDNGFGVNAGGVNAGGDPRGTVKIENKDESPLFYDNGNPIYEIKIPPTPPTAENVGK